MFVPKNLIRMYDILNSEGMVLGLFHERGNKKKLYLGSHLKKWTGNVFYSTNVELLNSFIRSEISISELYKLNDDVFVMYKSRSELKTLLKHEAEPEIFAGIRFYKDFEDGCKSKEFELTYG
jgi:hypothetical protein